MMNQSDINMEASGDTITKIKVRTVEIPCNAKVKDWPTIMDLLEKLGSLGAFVLRESSKVIEELAMSLGENEKAVVNHLPIDDFIPKPSLDSATGLKGRQLAGVLANITKKAQKLGLVGKDEQIYNKQWVNDENQYQLRPKFQELKNLVK